VGNEGLSDISVLAIAKGGEVRKWEGVQVTKCHQEANGEGISQHFTLSDDQLRQARIRESLGLLEHIWLNVVFQVEHSSLSLSLTIYTIVNVCRLFTSWQRATQTILTWPRDHPCSSPLTNYWWLGVSRFFPFHQLV
jgi:hypothetical protein